MNSILEQRRTAVINWRMSHAHPS